MNSLWWAKTFTAATDAAAVSKLVITCSGGNPGIGSTTLTVSIRTTSAGLPTGSDIETSTATDTQTVVTNVDSTFTCTFASPVTVTPGTVYALVMRWSSSSGTSPGVKNQTTQTGYSTSSNSGSSWTAFAGGQGSYTITFVYGVYGFAYKTNATTNTMRANNFVGFAQSTVAAGAATDVIVGGVDASQSGLVGGNNYYLSDTPGAISTTAGTQSRKAGLGLSSTEILIRPQVV